MLEAMVVVSPSEFATAVARHPFADLTFEPEVLRRAAGTLADAGLLLVGEPHGVCETPGVLGAFFVLASLWLVDFREVPLTLV